jgi:type IV pilus assembly protein PilN
MKFELNLATRTYLNRRVLYLVYSGVIGLLLVLLALNLVNAVFLQGHIRQLQTYLKAFPDPAMLVKGTTENLGPSLEQVVEDIRFANSILEKKHFYWTGFLDRLEILAADEIKIRAIQPNFSDHTLRLNGLAANLGALQKFLERLSGDDKFSDYFLLKQGRTSLQKEGSTGREAVSFAVLIKGVV